MYIDEESEETSPNNEFETFLNAKEGKEVPTEDDAKQEDKGEY